jgi:thiamine biosynthesis lipoprotein
MFGDMRHHEEEVMGTVVTFDLFDDRAPNDHVIARAFTNAAALLHEIDRIFSTWMPESPMSRLRRGEIDLRETPEPLQYVLDQCQKAKDISGGWFDPWSLPGGVDPTGYVKGWAAQEALQQLLAVGTAGTIVNAAGDIALDGSPDGRGLFRIGIVNPFNVSSIAGVAEVATPIATSGAYERGNHLVNPFSGEAKTALASATVCGPDLGLCDALATALVVGGQEVRRRIEALDGYEALLIGYDRSIECTSGFALVSVAML